MSVKSLAVPCVILEFISVSVCIYSWVCLCKGTTGACRVVVVFALAQKAVNTHTHMHTHYLTLRCLALLRPVPVSAFSWLFALTFVCLAFVLTGSFNNSTRREYPVVRCVSATCVLSHTHTLSQPRNAHI